MIRNDSGRRASIGIPRALGHYHFRGLWEAFFTALGHPVIVSHPTDRKVLDAGCSLAPGEACLPIKCFVGHVLQLAGQADCVFIPRLVCLRIDPRIKMSCPKLIGLPDMIRALCPGIRILSVDVDLRREEEAVSFARMGTQLGHEAYEVDRAYRAAVASRSGAWKPPRPSGPTAPPASQASEPPTSPAAGQPVPAAARPPAPLAAGPRIGLLGHPYLLDDPYLGMDLAQKLRRMGCSILCARDLPVPLIESQRETFEPVSWFFEEEILCAASAMLREHLVDGLVHLLSFGCCAGSITSELIELEIRNGGPVPVMRVIIDEQTGDAGLMTRLESFADMLDLRRRTR